MRISDWSSDVCSSDLLPECGARFGQVGVAVPGLPKQCVGPVEVRAEPERQPLAKADHLAMADAPGKGGGIEHIDDQLPALVHRVRTVAIRAHACRDRKSTRLNSSH